MSKIVTYEQFKEYQRKKKYGDRGKGLRQMNLPDDFNPFQDEADEYQRLCYGEDEDDEEDFWLGETPIDQVIK